MEGVLRELRHGAEHVFGDSRIDVTCDETWCGSPGAERNATDKKQHDRTAHGQAIACEQRDRARSDGSIHASDEYLTTSDITMQNATLRGMDD